MRNYTNYDIANKAYSYLPDGAQTKPPIDIEDIIISNGIKIREDGSLSDGVIGKITFEESKAIISINPRENTYKSRRRFTLAHEFAHFVLHSNEGQREFIDMSDTMYRSDASNDYEVEANHFAACILMPEGSLIDYAENLVGYFKENPLEFSEDEFVRRLAFTFNVSIQSMRFRLTNMGILK
ncbi:ImmA/IrrE family metallo-endopeptidase [Acinetobacter sp. TW_SC_4]